MSGQSQQDGGVRGDRIRVLSPLVVNRIAAGEVVERPAAVVKELVENSLDAEPGRIEVAIEEGGRKLIRVTDDGVGMSPADLALAFTSHATSKLTDAADLLDIHTMGFRGEALSSIGSVAQVRIVSRARGSIEGAEIRADNAAASDVRVCGAAEGTSVEVRNLFYNTPARLKFLRTVRTEFAHVSEAFTRLALPFPAVTFHLTHDDKPVQRLTGGVEPLERIRQLFGNQLAATLIPAASETAVMRCSAWLAPPTEHRRDAQMIYTFLNGRYIRDRMSYRAVTEAYRGTLPGGRQPIVFLFIELDCRRVDVNVHPTKVEVRFREPSAVFAQVQRMVDEALRGGARATATSEPTTSPGTSPAARFAPRPGPAFAPATPPRPQPTDAASLRRELGAMFAAGPAPQARPLQLAPRADGGNCAQIHDAYIVEETPGGIRIIDQHALHERILYEEFARREGPGAYRQRLLLPQMVELRPQELELALELRPMLAEMGFEIEEFGGNAVAIQAAPQALDAKDLRGVLVDLIEELRACGRAGRQEARERALRMMACKGAVKAGQALRPEQVRAILERRDKLGIPRTCPHGRPTTWELSLDDLARRFGRK